MKRISNFFEKNENGGFVEDENHCCKVNLQVLIDNWTDNCFIFKQGGQEEDKTFFVKEAWRIGRGINYSSMRVTYEDGVKLIDALSLKTILPPWDNAKAKKFVTQNCSDNWYNATPAEEAWAESKMK